MHVRYSKSWNPFGTIYYQPHKKEVTSINLNFFLGLLDDWKRIGTRFEFLSNFNKSILKEGGRPPNIPEGRRPFPPPLEAALDHF